LENGDISLLFYRKISKYRTIYGILNFDFNHFYSKFVELENALTYKMTSCQNTKQSKLLVN
jgi:hypothetical protein